MTKKQGDTISPILATAMAVGAMSDWGKKPEPTKREPIPITPLTKAQRQRIQDNATHMNRQRRRRRHG